MGLPVFLRAPHNKEAMWIRNTEVGWTAFGILVEFH